MKRKYPNYRRQRLMSYCPQPEVIACQGGGEMFKSCKFNLTTDDVVGTSSRNPPVDIYYRELSPFEEEQLGRNHPQIYKFLKRYGG